MRVLSAISAATAIYFFAVANADTSELLVNVSEDQRAIIASALNDTKNAQLTRGVIAAIAALVLWVWSGRKS